ncbi:hypothetical protein [Parasitella parasitica]|uniref:C3H1-type domain-containing protein n=1 Tax=Parasitella parasitica TaxID=35722 RepID=A0A0B7MXT2_9FUNG|nr:hypothetical protein [Parasitella parasitica]
MATDQEMIERIAKLSTAIQQHKSVSNNLQRSRGGYYSPPSSRGRPSYVSYRGRGGNMSLSNTAPRNTVMPYYSVSTSNKYIKPVSERPSATTHLSSPLVASNNRSLRVSNPPLSAAGITTPKSHNKKLIINHKGTNTTANNTTVKSIDALTGRKQVAIDGIDFVVKGKKLIRKDLFDSNMTRTNLTMANTTAPKISIRKSIKSPKRRHKNKNFGKAPTTIRHPRQKGNMVFVRGPEGYVRQGRSGKSLVLNTHRCSIKKLRNCGFFTRYGKCPNGARCPFVHDTSRRAICPRFLQNRCKKAASECRLSHTPNPHIMPHCVHFQKGHCMNDPCIYAHVLVSKDAPVCRAFAMEGYCPKGLECDEKHIHVCPEFAETGICSNANCRLPHVARRSANNRQDKQAAGIVRLGSWVSPQYYHAQKLARAEKRKAIEEATAAKVWTRPALIQEEKEQAREKEEQSGFVRLFDDSDDDDGWSQYERGSDVGAEEPLRFKDDDEEDDDDEEEEDDDDDTGDDYGDEDEDEVEVEREKDDIGNKCAERVTVANYQGEESDQDDFFYDAAEIGSSENEIDDEVVYYEKTSDIEMSDS